MRDYLLQMAVVASEDGELVMQDPLTQDNSIVTETGEEIDEVEEEDLEMQELKIEPTTPSKSQSSQNDPKLQKEMETCFGFDEVSDMLYYFICFLCFLKFSSFLKTTFILYERNNMSLFE